MPGLPSQYLDSPGSQQSPWGDLRTLGAGALSGLSWTTILPIALAFFGSLFSDSDPEVDAVLQKLEMDKYMQSLRGAGMQPPYRSPNLAGLDRATLMAILNRMKRSSNWGWPAGKQMDLGFLEDLLGDVSSGGVTTPYNRRLIRR